MKVGVLSPTKLIMIINTSYNHYYNVNLKPKGQKQLRQLNAGAYLIKNATKNKNWKYVQILAARKNQADWEIPAFALNVSAHLTRMWKIIKILAPRNTYKNTVHTEKMAASENVADSKIIVDGKIMADVEIKADPKILADGEILRV